MSGIAPPSNYNFLLPEPKLDSELKQEYQSYHKCANNIDCFKDYYEGLAFAKNENRPVLLDFYRLWVCKLSKSGRTYLGR